MKDDPTMRECPGCATFCPRVLDAEGRTVAEMVCRSCSAEFCYYHSNAHVGRPCNEYEHDITQQDMQAMTGTQVCPSCGIRTDKDGGCNHMTCKKCGQEWCWTCGAVYGTCDCSPLGLENVNYRLLLVVLFLMLPVLLLFWLVGIACALTMMVYVPLCMVVIFPCAQDCHVVYMTALTLAAFPLWILQMAWML